MKIVNFSGGKDSTAMLIYMVENKMEIDKILWFDAETWEFPQMYDHIKSVEKYIGMKITRVTSRKSFDYLAFEHIITRGPNKGKKAFGFPSPTRRWCTREKANALDKYSSKGDTVYIGFASDELKRTGSKNLQRKINSGINIKFPLIDIDMTESEALAFCYERGFNWLGLYQHFKRVSCWCCPLQKDSELHKLYLYFPKLWKRLEEMQNKSWNSFRMDYTRIEDYTRIYKEYDTQLELFSEKKRAAKYENNRS